MALRFNPPPGWPLSPGFTPEPGWQPDPSWPPQPPGWQLWVNDDQPAAAGFGPGQYDAGQYGASQYGASQYGASQYGASQPPGSPFGAGPYAPGQPTAPFGAGPYAPGPPQGTSGWAISSFVLGLIGVWPLGLIFGIIGARRVQRSGQKGKGFAIAGIALSMVWLSLYVALIAAAVNSTATRSPASGKITHKGHLSVFSLAVGDCFNNPTTTTGVRSVNAIPCTQPHNAQVYAKFQLSGSNFNYPGQAKVIRMAENGCNVRLNAIDKSKATNDMTVHFLFPEEGSWIDGRRAVSCLIVDKAGSMSSSLLKS